MLQPKLFQPLSLTRYDGNRIILRHDICHMLDELLQPSSESLADHKLRRKSILFIFGGRMPQFQERTSIDVIKQLRPRNVWKREVRRKRFFPDAFISELDSLLLHF